MFSPWPRHILEHIYDTIKYIIHVDTIMMIYQTSTLHVNKYLFSNFLMNL